MKKAEVPLGAWLRHDVAWHLRWTQMGSSKILLDSKPPQAGAFHSKPHHETSLILWSGKYTITALK